MFGRVIGLDLADQLNDFSRPYRDILRAGRDVLGMQFDVVGRVCGPGGLADMRPHPTGGSLQPVTETGAGLDRYRVDGVQHMTAVQADRVDIARL